MHRFLNHRRIPLLGLLMLAAGALLGCAREEPLFYSGFLSDGGGYDQLLRDASRLDKSSFRDNAADYTIYQRVMIDQPAIMYDVEESDRRLNPEQEKRLADELKAMLVEQLGSKWQVVDQPAPDALRVRAALTKVVATGPRGSTGVLDRLPLDLSNTHMEAEVLDSMTARRLAATVGTRRGASLTQVQGEIRFDLIRGALRQWAADVKALIEGQ